MIEVKIQGRVYQVREDIGTAGALEWIDRFWVQPRLDVSTDEIVNTGLRAVAKTLADAPFLIERLVKMDGKPVKADDVPLWHLPELMPALHKALHLAEFVEAMNRRVEAAEAESDTDAADGTEKN